MYGREETLTNGEKVKVDDDYIKESILRPQAKIVAGFTGANMPSYQGQLDEKQIAALIEFIKAQK